MIWLGVGSVLVGLVVILIVIVVGFFRFGWDNSFMSSIVRGLRIPVALYNNSPLSFDDYQTDIDTLNHFYAAQAEENTGQTTTPTATFLQKSVLSRIIREHYTEQLAEQYDVTVTAEELNSEFDAVVAEATSEEEVVSTLTRLYEWTPDQFKQKVLRPYLLRSKLETAIGKDQSLNADAKTEADSVLAKINAGEITFEDAAKQYSDDVTASSGGDLGFFSTGQMVSEFETAAFALQPGETSGVVQTQFGYHIIRVTERVAATDDAPEQVRASHILFKGVDLDTYTNQQLAEASIAIFPKGLEWKDDCGLVLGVEETCEQNELLDVAQQTSTPTDSQTQPAE